jgi:hypothetical protein
MEFSEGEQDPEYRIHVVETIATFLLSQTIGLSYKQGLHLILGAVWAQIHQPALQAQAGLLIIELISTHNNNDDL